MINVQSICLSEIGTQMNIVEITINKLLRMTKLYLDISLWLND